MGKMNWMFFLGLIVGIVHLKAQTFSSKPSTYGFSSLDSIHLSHFTQSYFNRDFSQKTHRISDLRNGKEYHPPSELLAEGSFYFQSEDWTQGSLIYNGEIFQNIPLKYDLNQDVLITYMDSYEQVIQFIPEKLGGFQIYGHTFFQYKSPNTSDSLALGIRSGIYEILYSGSSKILAKRIIHVDRTISGGKIEYHPLQENRYYIFHEQHYYPFNSLKSLFKILDTEKSSLQTYISQEKIQYKKNPETTMVLLAKKLDQLSSP